MIFNGKRKKCWKQDKNISKKQESSISSIEEKNAINIKQIKKIILLDKRKNKHITIYQSAKYLNSWHFNIPRTTINSWKKQEEELVLFKNKNHLRTQP